MRANLHGTGSSFGLNGGSATLTENLNHWFGGRLEFNAWGGTVSGTNVSAQTYTYGPVFSYRKAHNMTAFGHVQFGAIHASQGFLGISEGASKFAMAAGGGVDFKLGKSGRAAIRLQGDYLMSRFLSASQDNVAVSTGIVFYLGHK
ncbi:MAG TPA: hypothetical protein VGS20_11295 [Candidatus Acidoferrales bacterium]|nr:hypothetical protein [Candidatus Acidoferrales bacterium]